MNRVEPPILGQAIFGTMNGLGVVGAGILDDSLASLDVFEFASCRERGSPLHGLKGDQFAFFRRACTLGEGRHIELLGFLAPCVDYSGRAGFFGTAVAIPADSTRPKPVCYDWFAAQEMSLDTLVLLAKQVDKGRRLRGLPGDLLFDLTPPKAATRVTRARGEETLLVASEAIRGGDRPLHLLQAASFMGGADMATTLLFGEDVPGALSIENPTIAEMETQMAERMTARQRQAVPKAPLQGGIAPRHASGLKGGTPMAALEARVSRLEEHLFGSSGYLEAPSGVGSGGVAAPFSGSGRRHAASPRPAGPPPKASIFEEHKPSEWKTLLTWAGFGVAVIILTSLLAWFVLDYITEPLQEIGRNAAAEVRERVG